MSARQCYTMANCGTAENCTAQYGVPGADSAAGFRLAVLISPRIAEKVFDSRHLGRVAGETRDRFLNVETP
jgi:hypothetical protein